MSKNIIDSNQSFRRHPAWVYILGMILITWASLIIGLIFYTLDIRGGWACSLYLFICLSAIWLHDVFRSPNAKKKNDGAF
jgi:hypothetical protein